MKKLNILAVLLSFSLLVSCSKELPIGYTKPITVYGYVEEIDNDSTASRTPVAQTVVTSINGSVDVNFTVEDVSNVNHYNVCFGTDGIHYSTFVVIPGNVVQINVPYSVNVKVN